MNLTHFHRTQQRTVEAAPAYLVSIAPVVEGQKMLQTRVIAVGNFADDTTKSRTAQLLEVRNEIADPRDTLTITRLRPSERRILGSLATPLSYQEASNGLTVAIVDPDIDLRPPRPVAVPDFTLIDRGLFI